MSPLARAQSHGRRRPRPPPPQPSSRSHNRRRPARGTAARPVVSKYCWVRCSDAPASASEAPNDVPCMGSCSIPSTVSGTGLPASRIIGATSITWVNGVRNPAGVGDASGPVHDHGIAGPAEVGADLLAPLERRVARQGPSGTVVGCHQRGSSRRRARRSVPRVAVASRPSRPRSSCPFRPVRDRLCGSPG